MAYGKPTGAINWESEARAHIETIDTLRAEVEQLQKQQDYLVEIIAKAAKWPKGCGTYAHTIGHIENVIINARCNLKVEQKRAEKAEAQNKALREIKDAAVVVHSFKGINGDSAAEYHEKCNQAMGRLDRAVTAYLKAEQALKGGTE